MRDYTRGDELALPDNDDDLETVFTDSDYDDVATDNAVRVNQDGIGEFAIFLFKNKHTEQQHLKVKWNGQSDRAPSISTIYLQIYNRTSADWETLASNDTEAADTDFDLEAWLTENLDDYFDAEFWISCRVYQEAI